MRALKDAMFLSFGVVGTFAYVKYGYTLHAVLAAILDNNNEHIRNTSLVEKINRIINNN